MTTPDYDAWARETPESPAARITAWLRRFDAHPIHGERDLLGIAYESAPIYASDLRALLRERDELRAMVAQQAETIKRFREAAASAVDLIRYLPGVTEDGRLALWCTDCVPFGTLNAPFWTDADASEQVTELCLANLVGIAEEHERGHHADEVVLRPTGDTAQDDPFQRGYDLAVAQVAELFGLPINGDAMRAAGRPRVVDWDAALAAGAEEIEREDRS